MKQYIIRLTGRSPLIMHGQNLDFEEAVSKWQRSTAAKKTPKGDDRHPAAEGKLVYVAPTADIVTQSVTARAALKSPASTLRAGLMVRGEVTLETVRAPVVVRREAIQAFRDWEVVFRRRGSVYEIAIVELGVVDGDYVEVRRGLSPGEAYVAGNSFVVKAELGKAGATHDH